MFARHAPQGQLGYNELRRLFEEVTQMEPTWEKSYFQYARWVGRRTACTSACGVAVDKLHSLCAMRDWSAIEGEPAFDPVAVAASRWRGSCASTIK